MTLFMQSIERQKERESDRETERERERYTHTDKDIVVGKVHDYYVC